MPPRDSRRDWRLLALLAFAAGVRLLGLNWDQNHHFHPDERAIAMAIERISFSPLQLNPQFFAYGSFPFYVTRAVTSLLGQVQRWFAGYDGIILTGRAMSALWGTATVALLVHIGSRLYGRRAGLLAGFLLAATVLHVQNSHFAVNDVPLTFLVLLALTLLVRAVQSGRLLHFLAAGLAIGLAVATKFSALPILLPLAVAALFRLREERTVRPLLYAVGAGLVAAAGFFLGQPYAVLDSGAYFHDILEQSRMVRNAGIFPYTNQYVGTPKYLYDVGQMVLWGMGPILGIAALAGTVRWLGRRFPRLGGPEWVLLSWVVPFFLVTGAFDVKYLRYLLPIYPFLILWGAAELDRWWSRSRVGRAATVAVAAGAALWLFAFLAIYVRPHTVVTASEWFYSHVPAGTKVAVPHWEEGFPFPLPGRSPDQYPATQVPYYEQDNPAKIQQISRDFSQAEFVVFPTKRIYGSVTRAAEKFPMTSPALYRLFAGDLGYTLVRDFSSRPRLFGLEVPTELADESFSVYDHPRVLIFRNTGHLDAAEIERRILEGSPSRRLRRSDLLLARATSAEATGAAPKGAARADRPPAESPSAPRAKTGSTGLALGSMGSALVWLLALVLVGAVTLPIAYVLFPNLADRGAGLAKTLGLAAATYALAVTVEAGLLRNGAGAATGSFLLLAAAGVAVFVRRRREIVLFWRQNRRLLLAGEAVFAFGFLLFLVLRALNPEIHWGEKPMDFSILNILVRSHTLPPSDPWFSGAPLGYYVFGQQIVAFLTMLTGLSTRYTFNLAFGLLGGLIAQGAFSLARNWAGTWRAGWIGAAFTLLIGNLSGLREILVNRRPLDWHYFWATSRVIPDTINEYPFWSLLFADLHAHVLALPLFLLVLASALELVRTHGDPSSSTRRRIASALVLGFAVMAQALTNAWDIPLLAGLVLLTAVVAARSSSPMSLAGIGRAAVSFVVASASAIVIGRVLWVRGGGLPGLGTNVERGARGVDFLTHFGVFVFLALAWLAASIASKIPLDAEGKGRLRRALVYAAAALVLASGFLSVELLCVAGILLFLFALFGIAETAEERLASGLVAAAFFLVLLPQRIFVSDRMNTFFKLYFEAWVVFAVSTAVLVFGAWTSGTFDRWPRLLKGFFFLLIAFALFTSVTAGGGAVLGRGNPSRPVEVRGLSLDGLRHLEKWKPGEYLAVEWLRREVPGTPVILEAQGDSYQDLSRISMLTGIPTLLGWEHHVKQRGNPPSEVDARRGHVRHIYSSPDTRGLKELLRKYHVGYVYVGALERRAYPAEGLKKFAEAPDLFQVAYENPDVRIYRVVGGDFEDVISPVKEVLPVAEAPRGAPQDEPEEPPEIRDTAAADVPAFSGLREPRDAAADDRGRIWIADFGNSRLRIFQADGGFLGGWGGRGSGKFGLKEPCSVAIRGDDVYIADTWNGRIQHFTISGEWKGTAGDLYGPRGIAVAADGSVWVADTGNKRIAVYGRDLKPLRTIGKLGTGPLEFSDPVGIAVGPSGSMYVADAGNSRIQVLSTSGAFERAIRVPAWSRDLEPHLEVDDDGTIYAADPKGDALLVISAAGQLQETRANDDAGQPLSRPSGVAIDRKNRILYVVNSGSNAISKWTLSEKGKP